jgi:hypothetical protein
MDWIGLAQDRDKWRAFVNVVMVMHVVKVFIFSCAYYGLFGNSN